MDSNAPNSKKVDVLLQREQTIEQVSHLLLFTTHHAAQHTTQHTAQHSWNFLGPCWVVWVTLQ